MTMQRMKLSTPRPIPFTVVSIANVQLRLNPTTANAGGAMSFVVRVLKADGTSVAGSGSGGIGAGSGGITQNDGTLAPGRCFFTPGANDVNVIGPAIIVVSDANNLMEPRELEVDVTYEDPYELTQYGAAAAGTLQADQFTTDLAEADDDHWNGVWVKWTTGPLTGEVRKCTDYVASTRKMIFDVPYTAAPVAGNKFRIMNG